MPVLDDAYHIHLGMWTGKHKDGKFCLQGVVLHDRAGNFNPGDSIRTGPIEEITYSNGQRIAYSKLRTKRYLLT